MKELNVKNRSIFCNDNMNILPHINSESIDLIYLDPPFNKKKIFTAPIGSASEGASFRDIFLEEDIKDEWLATIKEDNAKLYTFLRSVKNIGGRTSYNFCYLAYMAIRLIELCRILKDTGSIYLHCDGTMGYYLKILMDIVFGEKNFLGDNVWKRTTSAQKGSQFKARTWARNTDYIFCYSKTNDFNLNTTRQLTEEEIKEKFILIDEKGERYYDDSSHIWRNAAMGARPNLCYEWRGFKNPHPSGWRLSKERLEEEYQKGNIIIKKDGKLGRRKYLKDYMGVPIGNLWDDINPVSGKEYLGYPTQKPLVLLERIIEASCLKNAVVLDPFCGCATTCVASERLGRKWIGIDVSHKAYELVKKRLDKEVTGDLFDWNKDITYSISPPKRTDLGEDYTVKKWVYILSNPKYPKDYKVGIAKDWKSRLNSYQTSDPDRAYKMEYKLLSKDFRKLEKYIHEKFENNHEWVRANLEDIIKEINSFKI